MRTLLSILRVLLCCVYLAILVVVFVPILIVCIPSRKTRILLGNVVGKCIGYGCLRICGMRIPFEATDEAKKSFPAIYISNHTSMLDIFIGVWMCPFGTCGVAKKQIIWYPFFGLLYWLSGHLRVDRGNHQKAIDSMREVADWIHKYKIGLWIWPEGTRSRDGRLLHFKKGFAHLALATRLPIVPVMVVGAHKGVERDTLSIAPRYIDVKVLEPIDTTQWQRETLEAHIADVEAVFQKHLPDDQKMLSGK